MGKMLSQTAPALPTATHHPGSIAGRSGLCPRCPSLPACLQSRVSPEPGVPSAAVSPEPGVPVLAGAAPARCLQCRSRAVRGTPDPRSDMARTKNSPDTPASPTSASPGMLGRACPSRHRLLHSGAKTPVCSPKVGCAEPSPRRRQLRSAAATHGGPGLQNNRFLLNPFKMHLAYSHSAF